MSNKCGSDVVFTQVSKKIKTRNSKLIKKIFWGDKNLRTELVIVVVLVRSSHRRPSQQAGQRCTVSVLLGSKV